jgi:uncharacterized protein (DUF488 family)
MEKVIYTVGHSNHSSEKFIVLLREHDINVVVDVRSAPYSRYVSHFNKGEIEAALVGAGFKYIFMGDQVGGMPSGPEYAGLKGEPLYEKIAAADSFRKGLARLRKGVEDGWRIVLMCAEEDPCNCHRHHLIARHLKKQCEIEVRHLRADGSVITDEKIPVDRNQLSLFSS